jgi:hypothetical protein
MSPVRSSKPNLHDVILLTILNCYDSNYDHLNLLAWESVDRHAQMVRYFSLLDLYWRIEHHQLVHPCLISSSLFSLVSHIILILIPDLLVLWYWDVAVVFSHHSEVCGPGEVKRHCPYPASLSHHAHYHLAHIISMESALVARPALTTSSLLV